MYLDLSIIIPAYNRVELLKYTLESVKRATKNLQIEIILVDDGSEQPLAEQLQDFNNLPIYFIRQINQGSIIARQTGLKHSKGEYIIFLDSDDLIHPDKLVAQVAQMNYHQADVSYTDNAITTLHDSYDSLVFEPNGILTTVNEAAKFYLKIQPMPHNPIYRRSYIQQYLNQPLIIENRIFDSVGDVWTYYNLAIYPAKIIKVDGYYTIGTKHDQDRFTDHWEKLGVSSLALMLAFIENCPKTQLTLMARQYVGECAFISWRKLPNKFNSAFEKMMLTIYKNAPKTQISKLGGKKFQFLAKIIGVKNAGRIFRYLQRPDYSKIRTISTQELQSLMSKVSDFGRLNFSLDKII